MNFENRKLAQKLTPAGGRSAEGNALSNFNVFLCFSWCFNTVRSTFLSPWPPDWPKVENWGFNANIWSKTAQSEPGDEKVVQIKFWVKAHVLKTLKLVTHQFWSKKKNIALVTSQNTFENDPEHVKHDGKMRFPKFDHNQSRKVPEGSSDQKQWFWMDSSFKTWWILKTGN